MKGRKPNPVGLKLITGNPGRRPIDSGAAVPTKAPQLPKDLSGTGRDEWERIAPLLERAGLVSELDSVALEAYCRTYAILKQIDADVDRLGLGGLVAATHTGYQQVTALFVARRQVLDQLAKLSAEFGLTPSSRARVSGLAAQGDLFGDDPMVAFLQAGGSP